MIKIQDLKVDDFDTRREMRNDQEEEYLEKEDLEEDMDDELRVFRNVLN